MIETAKVFTNGGSQAIRLPKSCRFQEDEVSIQRIGDITIIIPKGNKWSSMIKSLDMFTEDFMEDRGDTLKVETRESL